MKKIFIVFALLFTVAVSSGQRFYYGPMGSLNCTNIYGLDNASYRISVDIGGFLGYDFCDFFGLELRALYSNEGVVTSSDEYAYMDNKNLEIGYTKIPFFLKFTIAKHLYIGVAPEVKIKVGDYNWPESVEFNSVNYGAEACLGYQFDKGPRIEFGYNYMVTNAIDGIKDMPEYEVPENRIGAFTFSFGWKF